MLFFSVSCLLLFFESKTNLLKLIKYNCAMSLCVCCLVIMPVTKLSAGVADFAFRRYLSFILLNAPAGRMNNLPTADLCPTTLNHYF